MAVDDDQDLEVGQGDAAQVPDLFFDQFGKLQATGAEHGQVGVFQDQAAHQGGNDHVEPVCALAPQGAVGNPLQGHADQRGQGHGQGHGYAKAIAGESPMVGPIRNPATKNEM